MNKRRVPHIRIGRRNRIKAPLHLHGIVRQRQLRCLCRKHLKFNCLCEISFGPIYAGQQTAGSSTHLPLFIRRFPIAKRCIYILSVKRRFRMKYFVQFPIRIQAMILFRTLLH